MLMPALSPFSFRHADDAVRLGRATVWEEPEDGDDVPFGQKMLLVDGEEFPILELRRLEIAAAEGDPAKHMPLRNDLLNPISADNPAGENLRYAPVYDKIKEARREDDDAPQGDWALERKVADWPLTIKLISEALATKTKDLQLAAWLAEAMLRREGIAGLREVLDLNRAPARELLGRTLYPELEDGDAEFRAGHCNGSATSWNRP